MKINQETRLSFDGPHIEALCLEQAKDYPLQGQWIVANLSSQAAVFQAPVKNLLCPWSSTQVAGILVAEAERLVLLRIRKMTNLASVVLDPRWRLFANTLNDPNSPFPRDTPLWISAQDSLGNIALDPA